MDKAAEFVFKQFGKEGVKKSDIYVIQNKKKESFFDESSDEEDEEEEKGGKSVRFSL